MGRRTAGVLTLCVLVVGAVAATSASAATFSNPTPITDPTQGLGGAGADQPYPSVISVSGEAGTVVKARVTLMNLQGGYESDMDVLLVGPGGSTILMSDICSSG